ncbi:MAG: CHAT domain-containing protein [bacterium]
MPQSKLFRYGVTLLAILVLVGIGYLIQDTFRPHSVDEIYIEALKAIGNADYDKAIALCQEIIEMDSTFTPAYKKLQSAYHRANRLEEAKAYFESLRDNQPNNANVYLALGLLNNVQNQNQAALENFQKARELNPDFGEAYMQSVEVYAKMQKLDAIIAEYQARVSEQPELAAAHYGLGYAFYRTQTRWLDSFNEFEKALELDSLFLDVYRYFSRGLILTGNNAPAVEVLEKGLEVARQKNDLEQQSTFVGNLAIMSLRSGDEETAYVKMQEVRELARKIGYKKNEAAACGNLADMHKDRGEAEAAIKLNLEAIKLYKEANNGWGQETRYNNLGNLYHSELVWDIQKALACYDSALAIARRQPDPNPIKTAEVLSNIAIIHHQLGEYQKALDENDEALKLAEASRQYRTKANILGNRASIHADLGDTTKAFQDNRDAVSIYAQLQDTMMVARMLTNQGVMYHELADYSKVLKTAKKALTLLQEFGKAKSQEAITMNTLGIAYANFGQYRRANSIFNEALDLAESIGDSSTQIYILGDIALMYSYLNEPDSSLYFYRSIFKHLSRRLTPELYSILLVNMALVQGELNQYAAALDTAQLGLTYAQEVRNLPRQGFAYEVIGLMNLRLKNYQESLNAFQRSVEIHQKIGHLMGLWESYSGLGEVYTALENFDDAIKSYDAAISTIENVRSSILGEEQRSGFWQDKMEIYARIVGLYARVAEKEGDASLAGKALHYAERAKARTLLELVSQTLMTKQMKNISEPTRQAYVSLGHQIQAKYTAVTGELSKEQPDSKFIQELESAIEILKSQQDSVSLVMQKQLPKLRPRVLNYLEIQSKVLGSNQVLIEYLVGEEDSYVWMVTADKLLFKPLNLSRKALADLLAEVSPLFASERSSSSSLGRSRTSVRDHLDAQFNFEALQNLYNVLIGSPIGSELPQDAELVIVPDDLLFYLPFEILVAEVKNNQPEYLIENSAISYSSSASLLAPALYDSSLLSSGLLALGNPQGLELTEDRADLFAAVLPEDTKFVRNNQFTPLPFAGLEVQRIRAIYPAVTAFAGASATESLFKKRAEDFRILHLAVHGLANEHQPLFSGLALAPDQVNGEDGFLHAFEILNLELQAELVVLSACESAVGRLLSGEGLLSLTRSFFYAGAQSVVASLWSVSDETTAKLMQAFYANLKNGLSRNAALQQAKLSLIGSGEKDSNPFYWAPFVLMGQSGAIELGTAQATAR